MRISRLVSVRANARCYNRHAPLTHRQDSGGDGPARILVGMVDDLSVETISMRLWLWRRRGADIPAERAHPVSREEAQRLLAQAKRASERLARFDGNPNDGYDTPEQSD